MTCLEQLLTLRCSVDIIYYPSSVYCMRRTVLDILRIQNYMLWPIHSLKLSMAGEK